MQIKASLIILLVTLSSSSCAPAMTSSATQASEAVQNLLPSCQIIDQSEKLNVLSDEVFFASPPSEDKIERALMNNFPHWATYEQSVSWSDHPMKLSKIVREASYQEKFALNPEVTLVTLGESFEWQVPLESDVFEHSLMIGERLVRLWDEFSHPDNQAIRSQHPEISNGATYALYVFFNSNQEKLQKWCDTYQTLFGTLPMQR